MCDVHDIDEKIFKYSLVLGCFTSLEIVISVIVVVRTETCCHKIICICIYLIDLLLANKILN
jgi:hypothetical protein